MDERTGLARRAGTVARWPLGIALTSWRYLWRTTPLRRREEPGSTADLPPPLPEELVDERVQGVDDGIGPLFRRSYQTAIEGASRSPEELIDLLAEDMNRAAPVEMAVFRKTAGDQGPLRLGDEYLVRMPGPWDGPVRVVDRGPTSFRLATLRGHLEAGQIEFRARSDGAVLRFEIESWARSGDRLSELLFSRLRMAKEVQLHMWTHVSERAAALAGGRLRGGVRIHTRRVELG